MNGEFLGSGFNGVGCEDGFEKLVKWVKIEYMFFNSGFKFSDVKVFGVKINGVVLLKGKFLELLKYKIVVEDFKVSKVFKLLFLFSRKDRFKYF